jgi:tyrosinase
MEEGIQLRADALMKRGSVSRRVGARLMDALTAPPRRFTVFLEDDMREAISVAGRLMVTASTRAGEEGIAAALAEAESLENSYPQGLVSYSLMVFITHYPEASRRLSVPPLASRSPEKIIPSRALRTSEIVGAAGAMASSEAAIAWFREDALANEHHERWHVVYPFGGVSNGSSAPELRPREGELFLYMHEQMLARYDTERIAAGLQLVVPFADYNTDIPQAYDPGPDLSKLYSPRPPDQKWHDIQRADLGNIKVSSLQAWTGQLDQAISDKKFSNGTGVDPTLLGAAIEASIGSPSSTVYGSLHNSGHLMFSVVQDPMGTSNPGVMVDTATAIRDPVFFEWHRHVDDYYFRYQNALSPYSFADAPAARIRKTAGQLHRSPDVILCLKENIPGSSQPDFDPATWGQAAFGGTNWDTAPELVTGTTTELVTEMLKRTIQYTDDNPVSGPPVQFSTNIEYLDQREFYYFFRIENLNAQDLSVTARVFLGAVALIDSVNPDARRFWIEMDKFKVELKPNEKAVVFRSPADSSVIRKPAQKPPVDLPIRRAEELPDDPQSWCDCGWPYNLLVPRGTKAGMQFRLFVMLTDWQVDQVPSISKCGSMSYCGAKDQYPDTREMGYPFNRPLASDLDTIVGQHDNVATLDLTVRMT